jgi:hypothetical protein
MSQFRIELCGPYVSASITPPNNLHVTRLRRVSSPHVKALCANNFKFAPSFTGLMTSVFATYVNKWIPIYLLFPWNVYTSRSAMFEKTVRKRWNFHSFQTKRSQMFFSLNVFKLSTSHKFSFENHHPHKAFFRFQTCRPETWCICCILILGITIALNIWIYNFPRKV